MSAADWHDNAACQDSPVALFYPAKGESGEPGKQVCASCPVRLECLRDALEHGETGVWGGLDEEERRALRKAQLRRPRERVVA